MLATTELAQWQAAQAFVGREYVPGEYDCAHLAVDVQRSVFARHVTLPAVHRQGRAGQAVQIKACRDELAQRIDAPQQGCGVLFDSGDCWHIGTVFFFKGEPWVLHGSARMGSAALNRLRDLPLRGLKVEGFYLWK